MTVALGVTVAVAMLLFPALHRSRENARLVQCQQNLMEIGRIITVYAWSHGRAIPLVAAQGREAFAGIVPVKLADAHVVDRRQLAELVLCPATRDGERGGRDAQAFRIPTLAELMSAREDQFKSWRRSVGGGYAYRFGYINSQGRYCEWRLDGNPRSAIVADMPSLSREGFQSSNHGGSGQNALFADGHVDYVAECASLKCGDHLYKNAAGYRAAPHDASDTVLGRSEDPPGVDLFRLLNQ